MNLMRDTKEFMAAILYLAYDKDFSLCYYKDL